MKQNTPARRKTQAKKLKLNRRSATQRDDRAVSELVRSGQGYATGGAHSSPTAASLQTTDANEALRTKRRPHHARPQASGGEQMRRTS